MKFSISPRILILGSQGMLGRIVYSYLAIQFPKTIWKTSRKKANTEFLLHAETTQKDFEKIIAALGNVQYVINCIGALRDSPQDELERINTKFPLMLSTLSEKYFFKIIHISTDAVFSSNSNTVRENDTPSPEDEYAISKLRGEQSIKNVLNIRTSIIGFDPNNNKGLLEWILHTTENSIKGYTNQIWSGCTVLQYAKLCEKIISQNLFGNLRKKSHVFHFSPITPVSKYQLIKDFLTIMNFKKKLVKAAGKKITRELRTNYEKELHINEFKRNDIDALKELIEFEKMLT